jgi:thiol-disulfide isomerase/thioredoxin
MRIPSLLALLSLVATAAFAAVPPLPDDLKPVPWKPAPEFRQILDEFETIRDETGFRDYLAKIERTLEEHPDWIDLHRHYIGVARLMDEWGRVQPKYKEWAEKDTTKADQQYLAGLFERTANPEYFRRALRHDPKNFYARCALALTLLSLPTPNQDEAFPLLFEAVRMRPDHPYGYQSLALAYEISSDWESGIKVRKLCQIVEPKSFQPVQYEARDLDQAGRPGEALARIEEFIKSNPASRSARRTLIDVYRKQGRPDDAVRAQIDLAEMAAEDGDEAYRAAKALAASDKASALGWLRKASQRGYDNYREAEKNQELAPLRDDPSFAGIIAEYKSLREKGAPTRRSGILAKLVSSPAPSFDVMTLDSTRVTLAGLKGKVVVLDFWATWCGPCRMTLPLVKDLQAATKDKPVEILCMNVWERDAGRSKVVPYWKESGYPMTVGLASPEEAQAYGVTGIPTLFVLDQEGQIRFRHVGFSPYMDEEVGWVIDSLLQGKGGDRGENMN